MSPFLVLHWPFMFATKALMREDAKIEELYLVPLLLGGPTCLATKAPRPEESQFLLSASANWRLNIK